MYCAILQSQPLTERSRVAFIHQKRKTVAKENEPLEGYGGRMKGEGTIIPECFHQISPICSLFHLGDCGSNTEFNYNRNQSEQMYGKRISVPSREFRAGSLISQLKYLNLFNVVLLRERLIRGYLGNIEAYTHWSTNNLSAADNLIHLACYDEFLSVETFYFV